MHEYTFSYTSSECDKSQDLKSEYVGYEARKHVVYHTTSDNNSEQEKEVAQEQNNLLISPSYGDRYVHHILTNVYYLLILIIFYSYIYSSACKLEEDEITVMKFTNETLKQQPSEDFTNINEDEPFAYTGRLSTAFEQYEKENSDRMMTEFERSKKELLKDAISDKSSTLKVLKISCLSILKPLTTTNASVKYSSGSMSPGAKFKQRTMAKISTDHVDQFLRHKHINSNSCDKLDRQFKRSLFDVESYQKSKYEGKENIPTMNIQDNLQRTPNIIDYKLKNLSNYDENNGQKQFIITPGKPILNRP